MVLLYFMFSLFYLLGDLYDDSEVPLLTAACISSIWYYISTTDPELSD